MDVETYAEIFRKVKGLDPYRVSRRGKAVYNDSELAFRKDVMNGKICFTNELKSDLYYFVIDNHPLLNVMPCLRIPHHPYKLSKRIITLVTTMCIGTLTVGLSAYWGWKYNDSDEKKYGYKILIALIDGIVITALEATMRLLSYCMCRENVRFRCLFVICSDVRSCFIYGWMSVAAVSVIIALVVLASAGSGQVWTDFLVLYSTGFLYSWLFSLLILVCKGGLVDIKADRMKQEEGDHNYLVTFMEYEYLMSMGSRNSLSTLRSTKSASHSGSGRGSQPKRSGAGSRGARALDAYYELSVSKSSALEL